jgi:hypothetical protein
VSAGADESKAITEGGGQEAATKAAAYSSYLAQVAQASPDPARRLAAQEVLDRPTVGDPFHTYLQQMAREHPDPAMRARAVDVLTSYDIE